MDTTITITSKDWEEITVDMQIGTLIESVSTEILTAGMGRDAAHQENSGERAKS